MRKSALRLTPADTVATALEDMSPGDLAAVSDEEGAVVEEVEVRAPVARGHKLALEEIRPGQQVMKYGYSIGVATRAIARGEHVHTENLSSERGRGDL